MTLLLPTIFYVTIKILLKIMDVAAYTAEYVEQELPGEIFGWLGYTLIPPITATLVNGSAFLHGIVSVPIYFWNLVWHPNGRSIIDMLRNPEGNGRFISSNKQNRYRIRWRERARPVPRWVWRRKPRRLRFCWSTVAPDDTSIIQGYDSRLCMFSYYQIHPTSINKTDGTPSSEDGVTADTKIITSAATHTARLQIGQCIKSIQKA